MLQGAKEIKGGKTLVRQVSAQSPKELRDYGDRIKDKLQSGILLLGAEKDGKAMLLCMVTEDHVDRFKAGDIIRRLSEIVGGKGGGRPDMAQGGGSQPEKMAAAFDAFEEMVAEN